MTVVCSKCGAPITGKVRWQFAGEGADRQLVPVHPHVCGEPPARQAPALIFERIPRSRPE